MIVVSSYSDRRHQEARRSPPKNGLQIAPVAGTPCNCTLRGPLCGGAGAPLKSRRLKDGSVHPCRAPHVKFLRCHW